MKLTIEERFLKHTLIPYIPTDCWSWLGSKTKKGYGKISNPQKSGWVLAHRIAYKIFFGTIPEKLCVLHRCDNPECVNPTHLFLGTYLDNTKDRISKGRTNGCPGEKNSACKLKQDDVLLIKSDKRKYQQIADGYNVSLSLITKIKNGKLWKSAIGRG